MKIKNVQGVICLVFFFLFANNAWAADWIRYASHTFGDTYYDKSSIKKVNKNIIHLSNKQILNEDGKTKYFSFLKSRDKAPKYPNLINYVLRFSEIDCVKERIKDFSLIIYDEKSNVLYSSPKNQSSEWHDMIPNSVGEKLKNIVCEESVAPNEAVVAPKVEEPVAPKEAVVVAPAVTDKNLAQVNSKQNETKSIPKEAVRNLVTKWVTSWKSGDMKAYRSCYASDFQSNRMNLNAWISYKTNVRKNSKDINISIDDLLISVDENTATAVFSQSYSSSIFKDSGLKTLELRKINNEWKIFEETM